MKNLMNKIRKSNKGFTLVELIIVIAIIAVLTAVAAPQYLKYVENSKNAVIQEAANEVAAVAKAEMALGNLTGSGNITVQEGAVPSLGTGLTFNSTKAGYTWETIVGGALADNNASKTFTVNITADGKTSIS